MQVDYDEVLTSIIADHICAIWRNGPHEKVAALPDSVPLGNIAIGPNGPIFYSVHDFYGKKVKVVELPKDGTTRPYPNKNWASAPTTEKQGLYGVLGVNVDRNSILWLLDGATPERNPRIKFELTYGTYYHGKYYPNP